MKKQTLLSTDLGRYQDPVDETLLNLTNHQVISRIWAKDYRVWKTDPAEITNRLGWLTITESMLENIPSLKKLVAELKDEGFNQALLLGMGGSSLAPEVFREVFGVSEGALDLTVLDTTDPDAIREITSRLGLEKTVFIVATKSGGTVETLSFFKYFFNLLSEKLSTERAGKQFIAITDPGSKLQELADKHNFRAIFLNDPNIGGRYSALSYFGLVPAALLGVNLDTLLQRGTQMMNSSRKAEKTLDFGTQLGAIIGTMAKLGRDKLTLFTSPAVSSFGNWVEQLIAESTGKEGKGILPVVGEPIGNPSIYGDDRLFVYLQLDVDPTDRESLQALSNAGHPVVWIQMEDLYDLGKQFFLWEMATAVAGHILNINPFDQPNVESAKVLARKMVAEYKETGELPAGDFAPLSRQELEDYLSETVSPGRYISLQAYLPDFPEIVSALQRLRVLLRDRYQLATTLGFGPRFLHSTGQLHKGDGGMGIFIQFNSTSIEDLPIPNQAGSPESDISFGLLKNAQALGDAQALMAENREIIRFDLGSDAANNLAGIMP